MQGPQDYRDADQNIFKAMAYEEYRGFFQIGMVERNEHNAIIQHGTMTIVRQGCARGSRRLERRGASPKTPNWACKLFEAGYERGLSPRDHGRAASCPTRWTRS